MEAGANTTDGFSEHDLVLGDGRVVAWTEWGRRSGRALLRLPGTPGCRWSVPGDVQAWAERDLFVLTTERPGFGASTWTPGRGFFDHADDLVHILDAVDLRSVHVIGPSGAAPFLLALCQRHPGRVAAVTVIAGSAPITDADASSMLEVNRRARMLARAGDRSGLTALLDSIRRDMLGDIRATLDALLTAAPDADRRALDDRRSMRAAAIGMRHALAQGVDGWADEALLCLGEWSEIQPERIATAITWHHARADPNCPFEAARRFVESLPNARLVVAASDVGHDLTAGHDGEILDELICRGR